MASGARKAVAAARPVVDPVAPGFIATEMLDHVPERVCADESAYITGQAWAINGGMDM